MVPYVRVGTQGGEDHFTVNYSGLFGPTTVDRFESKKVNWDWLVAAGVEVPLFSKKFTLRLEYDYLFEHEVSYNDDVSPAEVHYSYTPHAHVVKLQWVWNFGC